MMDTQKSVAIILVNYNGWQDTIECLDSIFQNQYSQYQVFVCDNASTNNSLNQIESWLKEKTHPHYKLPVKYIRLTKKETETHPQEKTSLDLTKHPQVVLIDTGFNLGFAGGNNVGIRYALKTHSFDAVWLLNNDTQIDTLALSYLVKGLFSNESTGITGSKLLFYYEPDTIQSYGTIDMGWKGSGHSLYFGKKDLELPDLIVKSVIGASLMIKTKVVDEIGLMDEVYFMQDEETDWCARAYKHGYHILTCGKSRVFHKEGKSSDRISQEKNILGKTSGRKNIQSFLITGYYSTRNEIYFIRKNFPKQFALYLLLILPVKLTRQIIGFIVFGDTNILLRISLLVAGVKDGLIGKMGMTKDPAIWKKRFQ